MTSDLFGDDLPEQPEHLTDEKLRELGLKPVRSFIRTDASKAALRTAKHRAKLEAEGRAQLNVVAPLEVHELVKEIARRTAAGEDLGVVLSEIAQAQPAPVGPAQPAPVVPAPKVDTPPPAAPPEIAKIIEAARRPGFRGWMIRRLAGV
jgi:hypothetical protein